MSLWGDEDKEQNRKDVGHLVQIWNQKTRFYWVPGGDAFPGLDSVFRDESKVYFIQVKTGAVAKEASRWIEKAFHYSLLLLDALGKPSDVQASILVGAEPSNCPVLGKRKRTQVIGKFKKAKAYKMATWPIQYVTAPSLSPAGVSLEDQELDWSLYEKLLPQFNNFMRIREDEEQASPEDETGAAVSPAEALSEEVVSNEH